MAETCLVPTSDQAAIDQSSMEERLERGDVVYFPICPFLLPEGDDRRFLLEQQLGGRSAFGESRRFPEAGCRSSRTAAQPAGRLFAHDHGMARSNFAAL